MARVTKQGVDYFPLDVHTDDKFKFIEIKFKLEGFAVIVKLFQRIYAQGYWCEWGEDEVLIFAHEIGSSTELLNEIVTEALKRDIFCEQMYDEYKILTSQGIQKRYKEIVKRRKGVDIVTSYLLIDDDFGVNANTMYTQCKHDVSKSTQSKVKESKVKESTNTIATSKNSSDSISSKFEINKDWAQVVFDWLEYKKERRETYKSDRSIKSFITKLRNLSGDDPAVAREIVEQSFANNYAGVFELKKQTANGKDRRDSETANREQQIMQLAREAGMA